MVLAGNVTMAGLDTVKEADNSQAANEAVAASARLSLEGNAPAEKSAAQTAPPVRDRGHHAAAGHENDGMKVPPPRLTDHQNNSKTDGIDVSEFQNNIDWQKVQKSGVKFAYIRATDGTTIQDADFAQNIQGAQKEGIPAGAYHFFSTSSPVQSQIDNFVATVKKGGLGTMPPVLDVEDPKQFANIPVQKRIDMIQQWLTGVENALGVRPMLYMSSNFSGTVLNNAKQFDSYRLWVADDTTAAQPIVPQPWTGWDFWQHSDSGVVPGIVGNVDMDYFNGPETALPTIKPAPSPTPKV
jgi:lysozyme